MSLSDQLSDLLLLWEEQRDAGRALSPEELCADHPELLPALQKRIRALEAVYRLREATNPNATASPGLEGLPVAGDGDWPRITGYQVLEKLGHGGMGLVYKVLDLRLNRPVALKIIPADGSTPDGMERFLHEAKAVAQVRHPHIVQIYESGRHGNRPYFTMEYVEGGTLATRANHAPQPIPWTARMMEMLARAVHAAHQQGIIHRDLKPSNVLLTAEGMPKISDFGLAKRLQVEAGLTPLEAVLGTPSYMAPEQAKGRSKEVGPATDIYGLGAILYELLTGRPPFQGDTALETMRLVAAEEPVPPRRVRPKIPADLETICLKCLRKEASKRYASALALAEDLRRFQAREPIAGRRPHLGERLVGWGRRRPVLLVLLISAVLIAGDLLGSGAWFMSQIVAERNRAVRESRRADTSSYALRITLAQRELHDGRVGAAVDILEKCPRNFCGWEYRYLSAECQRRMRILHGHQGLVLGVAYSPDGRFLASYGGEGPDWPPDPGKPGQILLWDPATGQKAATFPVHAGPVTAAVFSSDGRHLVSAAMDGSVHIWEVATRHEVRTLTSPVKPAIRDYPLFGASIVGLLGAPQGQGPLLAAVVIPRRGPIGMALSPNGERLATVVGPAESPRASAVRVWDLRTGAAALHLPRPSHPLTCVAFSPDGRFLAGGDSQGTITLWDARTGIVVRSFAGPSDPFTYLCFSPEGHRLAGATGNRDTPEKPGEIRVWNVETGKVDFTLAQHTARISGFTFRPDGRQLASTGFDGTVRVWDMGRGSHLAAYRGWSTRVMGVAFSPDGRHVASAGPDATVKIWEVRDGTAQFTHHFPQAVRLAFRPDGRQLTCAYADLARPELPTGLAVWDLGSDRAPRLLTGHTGPVGAVAYSPDGRRVASGGTDGTVRIWDPDTARNIHTLPGPGGKILSVAFSPDGRRLASGSSCTTMAGRWVSGEVTLWDPADGVQLNSFPGNDFLVDVSHVRINADRRRLVIGTRHLITIRDAVTGSKIRTLEGNYRTVTALALSPDGRWLATGTGDLLNEDRAEDVWIWDTATGDVRCRLTGHAGMIQSIAFSPDGRRLATAGSDRTVKLWDPNTGVEMLTLQEHSKAVVSVAFSADGVYLAAGGRDGVVRVWEAPP